MWQQRIRWTTLCLTLALAAPVMGANPPRIPVAVRVPAPADGWTDLSPDRADTKKDIEAHLATDSRKYVRRAAETEAARIVLEVMERHMEDDGGTHVITVMVRVGDYAREAVGRSDSTWFNAALNLVRQVDAWANENRDRIMATRGTH